MFDLQIMQGTPMAEATKHTITVDLDMFDKTPEEKTAHANEIAREFGVGEDALAAVEDFKKELTKHNAWDLPFMGYVNEDGYGYAYVPNAAITTTPYWDAHAAFLALPKDFSMVRFASSSVQPVSCAPAEFI